MSTITFPKTNAKTIDIAKRKIELLNIKTIKSIFNRMAEDAGNLYTIIGRLDPQIISDNYKQEFVVGIRNIYRKTIKEFGFKLRDKTEEKYFINFETKTNKSFFDIEYKQSVELVDTELDEKLNKVNQEFLAQASLFIANTSEEMSEYITKTNETELISALSVGLGLYSLRRMQLEDQFISAETSKDKDKIAIEIEKHDVNKNAFVGREMTKQIKKKSQYRAELITEDAVGISEAWSRQKEAELIQEAQIVVSEATTTSEAVIAEAEATTTSEAVIVASEATTLKVKKKWDSILDDRTRDTHVRSDGQVVNVEDPFIVGGYLAQYPRDPRLPIKERARCRCVANYDI